MLKVLALFLSDLSLLRILATSVDDSSVSIELLAVASLHSELGSTGPVIAVAICSSIALYLESYLESSPCTYSMMSFTQGQRLS